MYLNSSFGDSVKNKQTERNKRVSKIFNKAFYPGQKIIMGKTFNKYVGWMGHLREDVNLDTTNVWIERDQ